jgi:hypothetical protein
LAVAALATLAPAAALATEGALLSPVEFSGQLDPETLPASTRMEFVAVDFGLLRARPASLTLNLFPDVSLDATSERIELRQSGFFLWYGTVDGSPFSSVILQSHGGRLTGEIVTPENSYEIRLAAPGVHVVLELDTSVPPEGDDDVLEDEGGGGAGGGGQQTTSPQDDGSEIDMLLLYDDGWVEGERLGWEEYGFSVSHEEVERWIQAQLQGAVAGTNLKLENSNVETRIRLVHTQEVDTTLMRLDGYCDQGQVHTIYDLAEKSDEYLNEAHIARDTYKADLVGFVGTKACPVARTLGPYDESKMFFSVRPSSLVRSFSHETGHLLGGRHNRNPEDAWEAPGCNFGYVIPELTDRGTQMAYVGTRLAYFSNPDILYGYPGFPLGVACDAPMVEGQYHRANNALAFNENRPILATHRISDPFKPGDVLVVGMNAAGDESAIRRINPGTNAVAALVAEGLSEPIDVAPNGVESLFVLDTAGGTTGAGALLHIDPTTGGSTVVTSDGYLQTPNSVVREPAGTLLVTNRVFPSPIGGTGRIIRIDPVTGQQTILTEGSLLQSPQDLAMEKTDDILVADACSPSPVDSCGPGAILRIDPNGCDQSVAASGDLIAHPTAVVAAPSGDIFVGNADGSLVAVDPVTGDQSLVYPGPDGTPPGPLATVTGLALSPLGMLIATDGITVAWFDPNPAPSLCGWEYCPPDEELRLRLLVTLNGETDLDAIPLAVATATPDLPACLDGIDNDNDGLVDFLDPGCSAFQGGTESPSCGDGFDNDRDGTTDTADQQCARPSDDGECGSIDTDADGILDGCDNCVDTANAGQLDSDWDLIGNACDPDLDNDGDVDSDDLALFDAFYTDTVCDPHYDATADFDGDGEVGASDLALLTNYVSAGLCPGPSYADPDADADRVHDACDNCPNTPNGPAAGTCSAVRVLGRACLEDGDCGEGSCSLDQQDMDQDGIGDVCDPDPDGDGDFDNDGIPDDGGDHLCSNGETENCDDNCIATPNGPQEGTCTSGTIGLACAADSDCNGGVCSFAQEDSDGDAVGNTCDGCPSIPNFNQVDQDGDQVQNACDNCVEVFNPVWDQPLGSRTTTGGQLDDDADGIGNACDVDFNNDGQVTNADLWLPMWNLGKLPGEDDCRIEDVPIEQALPHQLIPCELLDVAESFSYVDAWDATHVAVLTGMLVPAVTCDACPLDCLGDFCDEDDDGIADDKDNCRSVPNPRQRDSNRDGIGNFCDADLDNDGVPETADGADDWTLFQSSYGSSPPDPDADFDGDGAVGAIDSYLFSIQEEADWQAPGPSGLPCSWPAHDGTSPCEVQDADLDEDGVPDYRDNCVTLANGSDEDNQADSDRDGFGNRCDGDYNNDGPVDSLDADIFFQFYGEDGYCSPNPECDPQYDARVDHDSNGCIDIYDLIMSAYLAHKVGPSGLMCANARTPTTPCPATAEDLDGDGLLNTSDNCLVTPNAENDLSNQIDTDGDGIGNACDADYDNFGKVNLLDFSIFKQAEGMSLGDEAYNPDVDSDGDDTIGDSDFAIFKSLYNKHAGPSGLACADRTGATAPCYIQHGSGDTDGDHVVNDQDNCVLQRNGPAELSDQIDSDGDGFGNACDADYDNSGNRVNLSDFSIFKQAEGKSAAETGYNACVDADGDDTIGDSDLEVFQSLYNKHPGPSGLVDADASGVPPCEVQ